MKFRKLRIVFSAVCGIVCLLLSALWVRSQYARDQLFVRYSAAGFLWIVSERNVLGFVPRPASNVTDNRDVRWIFRSAQASSKVSTVGYPDRFGKMPSDWRFQIMYFASKFEVRVPKWMPVMLAAMLAVAPWLHWSNRFSLRTLLIGMTLVAVVLGAVVWAVR